MHRLARMLAPRIALLGCAWLLLCACDDDARNDRDGSGGSGAGTGSGGAPYTLASLDEPCGPNGITAQDALANVAPEYTATLTPVQEGQPTTAVIRIEYSDGALTCHPPFSTGETGPEVSEQVELIVSFAFTTEDGAFAEQVSASLFGGLGAFATVEAAIPADQIQGTYDPNMPGLYDVAVGFGGQFDSAGTTGTVTKSGKKSETVGEGGFVATWTNMP